MTLQNIIVALIILSATFYAGTRVLRKLKAFSPRKSSCAADCGCESKAKIRN